MVDRTPGPRARIMHGGRVEATDSFPESGPDYQDLTPGQRMEALHRLSRRAFTCLSVDDARKRLPGLPNRLVGGRR